MTAAIVFDAFGTLLDLDSACRRHAARLGDAWQVFSQAWRTKQMEYTWVRTLAEHHRDFARVTDDALAFVAESHGITDNALLSELRDSFDHLDPYPDVPPALAAVKSRGLRTAILSNGTPSMLAHQVRHAHLEFDAVLSVEPAQVFKPDARAYRVAWTELDCPPEDILFVSSNPWDVFGATRAGLDAVWVNRTGAPLEYALDVPVIDTLAGLPDLL